MDTRNAADTLATRRAFLGGAVTLAACSILPQRVRGADAAKPNSVFNGVRIGCITYSYRGEITSAEDTLEALVQDGLSEVELMDGPIRSYAGIGGGGRSGAGQQQAEPTDEQRRVQLSKCAELRKMYNDAGVTIYAWKQLNPNMSDEEFEYIFNVAEALGCTHTTLELPAGADAAAQLKRIGDFAMKKKIYAAYHTHTQGSMTVFDQAFAASKGNMANVDLGHWVAGGNKGGTPMDFLTKYHDRTASFHLKDRTTPEHCALNLPWGTGETPIKEILTLVQKNKWKIPASIELEYTVPEGSDAVKEVRKCLEYCRAALA